MAVEVMEAALPAHILDQASDQSPSPGDTVGNPLEEPACSPPAFALCAWDTPSHLSARQVLLSQVLAAFSFYLTLTEYLLCGTVLRDIYMY